jgi:hypothetical protein
MTGSPQSDQVDKRTRWLSAAELRAVAKGALSTAPRENAAESPLTPELKQFIDRAIVPCLVKVYRAERGGRG